MSMYESLISSLSQEVSDLQKYGKPQGRKTIVTYTPVRKYSSSQIKAIRKKVGLTQAAFANCIGVTSKAVEKWESGKSIPSGSTARMLELLDNNIVTPEYFISRM